MTTQKVLLNPVLRQNTNTDGSWAVGSHTEYEVIQTQNILTPKVGEFISEGHAQDLIDHGINVTVRSSE